MVICLGTSGTLVLRRARTRRTVGTSTQFKRPVELMEAVVPQKLVESMELMVAVLRKKLSHADGQGGAGLLLTTLLLLLQNEPRKVALPLYCIDCIPPSLTHQLSS